MRSLFGEAGKVEKIHIDEGVASGKVKISYSGLVCVSVHVLLSAVPPTIVVGTCGICRDEQQCQSKASTGALVL